MWRHEEEMRLDSRCNVISSGADDRRLLLHQLGIELLSIEIIGHVDSLACTQYREELATGDY